MENGGGVGGVIGFIIWLAIVVLILASFWKVYAKAGRPGWFSLIPIYNVYVLLQMAGKPGWWLILCFVPIANIIVMILAVLGLARNFGKGGGFAVGLMLLPIIFYPILAFGDAQFSGPRG
jgi:hypothetical protein